MVGPQQRVYPRVCGGTTTRAGSPVYRVRGNLDSRSTILLSVGLSPRVRGNLQAPVPASVPRGSIPACAGEPTAVTPRATEKPTVYPRVCGGTPPSARVNIAGPGLSPRVRGNRYRRRSGTGIDGLSPRVRGNRLLLRVYDTTDTGGLRSIPACAGEPRPPHSTLSRTTARGLSPRVRGNPRRPGPAGSSVWSIPACAGEPPGRG